MYVIRGGKIGGGVVVTLLQLLLKWMKKDDTCSIVTQLRQLNNVLFVCFFIFLFFIFVCYDFDLQLHGLMTWSIFYLRKIVFRSELAF